MFDPPFLAKENHTDLRQILDSIVTHTRALQSLGRPVETWDGILICIITSKLDSLTIKEWEGSLPNPSIYLENSGLIRGFGKLVSHSLMVRECNIDVIM
ncbi:hypothetical protein Trydic_g5820 [Trypoxylus dichotomus]